MRVVWAEAIKFPASLEPSLLESLLCFDWDFFVIWATFMVWTLLRDAIKMAEKVCWLA